MANKLRRNEVEAWLRAINDSLTVREGPDGLTVEVAPTDEVCDFCSAPGVAWCYGCRDVVPEPPPGYTWNRFAVGSKGDWSACQECAVLIERGYRVRLVTRCARRLTGKLGLTPLEASARIAAVQAAFWTQRTGSRYPHPARKERSN